MSLSEAFLEIQEVTFGYGARVILDDVTLKFGRGQVVAIMGGSGMGKTTLLKLIGGLITPQKGRIIFDGEEIHTADIKRLYAIRRRMGMLFQFGALFLVLMKLEAVGLRAAAQFMPSELSGGMARRAALARSIALDPDLIMYDEPFAGLDPISMGVTAKLIRNLNDALGATAIIVTHDVAETFAIADYVYMVNAGRISAQGTPAELSASTDPYVRQFLDAQPDGPVRFHYPAEPIEKEFGVRAK